MCQRCVKSRRVCRGMATKNEWPSLHSENSYASGQKKRPRGPRSTHSKQRERDKNRDIVLHRPLIDLKTNAILYFSHYHLQSLKETLTILKGVTTDFLPVWESNVESPILDLAVSSIALAVYSRTQQHPPAAIEASTKYHELLRLQRAAIPSLDQSNIDSCLIAIFFMSRFEDVVHSPSYPNVQARSARTLQSFSHHDGALAILKYWKHEMSHRYPATNIIKYTRRGMIRSAILRVLGLPEWIWDGKCFGEGGSELVYDFIVVRIVNLRHRLLTFQKDKISQRLTPLEFISKAEELYDEAQDLDNALQDWAGHHLGIWNHQKHILSDYPNFSTKYFYSSEVYIYSSPVYASVWILYYATRLLINSSILKILRFTGPHSNSIAFERRFEYLSVMKSAANDLALSVPCALQIFTPSDTFNSSDQSAIVMNENEDVKPYVANLIIWPLSIAANLSGVDIRYKSWFKSLLAHLGRVTGIALLETAESSSWPEL